MVIVDAKATVVEWPLAAAWGTWTHRRAVIVEVVTARGTRGFGEAAPLPGRSVPGDDLDAALASVAALRSRLPLAIDDDPAAVAEAIATSPSACFALETALLDARARELGVPLRELIAVMIARTASATRTDATTETETEATTATVATAAEATETAAATETETAAAATATAATETIAAMETVATAAAIAVATRGGGGEMSDGAVGELPICAVVGDVDGARRAIERGVTTLKLKRDARLDEIRGVVGPDVAIRLDANRSPIARPSTTVEFVEEPSEPVAGVPLALDELVAELDDDALDRRLARGDVAAIVVKPALVDGIARTIALAAIARRHDVDVVIGHALDGPIGMAACAELALALGGKRAAGLDHHPGLAAWRTSVPSLGAASIRGTRAAGLGLSVSDLDVDLRRHARTERIEVGGSGAVDERRLSISAAAVDEPRRAAIVTAGDRIDFATLATAARLVPDASDPTVIIAEPTIATIVRIVAAIEARRPIVLLHPRLPDRQHARQLAIVHRYPIPPDTLAVSFTSGSTGEPRAVALSRAGAIGAAAASERNLEWHDDDAWLLCLPLAHVAGLAVVVRCLIARRTIVLAPSDPDAMIAVATAARATLASWVPAQLAAIAERGPWPGLRAALVGGAATPFALREQAVRRGFPILTTYGATETWGQIATQPLARAGHLDAGVGVPLLPVRAGRTGAPDTIVVESPVRGTYLDDPADRGPLLTGDVGFVDDRGWLHVIGRRDDVIITGGENVHPTQVEDILASTPGIREACVFARPDPRWGQRVCAAIAFAPGATATASVLADALGRLAPHQRPRELAIVDHLPRTATGKIDRRACAAARTIS